MVNTPIINVPSVENIHRDSVMTAAFQKRILERIDKLNAEAMDVPDDGNSPAYIQRAFSFMTQCQSLITMLGPAASMFRDVFYPKWPRPGHITAMVGTLLGIKSSIEHGFLNRVENLILADAFSDLLGQAQHLF